MLGAADLRQTPDGLSSGPGSVIGIREPQNIRDQKGIKGYRVYLFPLLDGETEAQGSEATGSKSHGLLMAKPGSGPKYTENPSTVFLLTC